MTIKCISCGQFIPHSSMKRGLASFHFEPSSDRGREVNEWTCYSCGLRDSLRRDEESIESLLIEEAMR